MTILQKPDTINLSGNLVDFILSSSSAVSFVLKQDTRVLFEGNYTPNDNQRIEIDIKDIIEADLKAVFSDSSEPYEQSDLAKTYTAEIAGQTHTFTVIKAGVDRLATSAANFLKANWLTWQPQVKKVTYYLPESLTFYSVEASVVKVKAYFQQPDGVYSEETKQLLSIVAGRAYTVPVQYAVIAGKFESRLPAFYDVWFETVDGVRLSYIQRYVSSCMMSEDESWIVFENSLGGFDTFRAYGQESLTADHDHQLAEIGDITDEYNVDTTREFQKNTGYLADHERKWLLDFFPSRQKYLYSSNYLRRIVVTEDDTSYTGNELPSSYTFNYRFADAKPYLNLQRVEELPSDLTISIPDLSSFTIPPRLVEFPSQNLTEGVLFPVQNPYSENWATTTIGAILSYVLSRIIELGGDGTGGVGHTHANYLVLKALGYVDEYLTYNGKKIKAGYADEAGKISEENDVYLHKDREDLTNFLLKLLGGIITTDIKTENLVLGALGTGYCLLKENQNGNSYGELDELFVRKKAIFSILEILELQYSGGNYIFSPAGARCTKVEEYDTYYRCYFTADDGSKKVKNKFRVDDQVQCREFNIEEGVHENVSNKYYWRLCVGVGDNYIDLSKSVRDMTSDDPPAEGDSMVTIGNPTDESRQNVIIISVYGEGSPSFIQYNGINSFSLEGKAKTIISPSRNELRGTFLFETGENIKEYIDLQGETIATEVTNTVLEIIPGQITLEIEKQIGTVVDDVETLKTEVSNLTIRSDEISSSVTSIQVSVDTVIDKADAAQTTANNAYNKANSAQNTAASAEDIANAAKDLADTASTIGIYGQESYNQTSNPWSSWSGGTEHKHVGALWYNPNTGQTQVYVGTYNGNNWETIDDSDYATTSYFLQNSDKISAVVANFDSSGRPTSASGIITEAYGNSLWASVELENGEELISRINQTASTITIDASKINLNGYTVVNGGFEILTDGSFECWRGTIGGFEIEDGSLICNDGSASIEITVSGYKFFRLNSVSDDAFMRLRADDDICLDVTSYGTKATSTGIKVLCNSVGYGKAINSIGNVRLVARNGEWIIINGLSLNSRLVTSSTNVYTNDDIIIASSSSTITLYLSTATSPGKMIYVKRKGTGTVTVKGSIVNQDRNTTVSSLDITDYPPRLFFCHGSTWYEFSGRH